VLVFGTCSLGGVLLKHLLDWWQLRFVEYNGKAYDAMKSQSPEMHPHYWDAVSSSCMSLLILVYSELRWEHSCW